MSTYRPNEEWSCLMYQGLVARATTRRTCHYGTLSDEIDYGAPNLMGDQLRRISSFCAAHGRPDITVLLVSHAAGTPSAATVANVDQERERVFEFPWFQHLPPTLEDMSK